MIAVRVAEWVFSRVVPDGRRDSILGDLREDLERYRARRSNRFPTLRYLGNLVSVVLHYAKHRVTGAGRAEIGNSRARNPRHSRGPGSSLLADLKHAGRTIRKSPGFAVAVILTLALGIGANTAIFSVVHAVVLRPLPYEQPEELVTLWMEFRSDPGVPGQPIVASEPEFLELEENARSFAAVANYWVGQDNLTGGDEPVRVTTASVSANFLPVLRTVPRLGRGFGVEDDRPDGLPVAILTHDLWTSIYGADPAILDRSVFVDGRPFTVIGVLGPEFVFPESDVDLLIPNVVDRQNPGNASSHYMSMIARLNSGTSFEAAQAELILLNNRQGDHDTGHGISENHPVVGENLQRRMTEDARPALVMLLAAAAMLLLIACTNVGNLMFIRSEGRMSELSLRRALGAGRWALIRQTITESLVLAMIGGGFGTLLAFVAVPRVLAIRPESIVGGTEIAPNGTLLLFSAVLSFGTALLFGLIPALRLTHPRRLSIGTRSDLSGSTRMGVRSGLLTIQLCVSVLLLVGAGVVTRNLVELIRVETGFETERVTTFAFSLDVGRYPEFGQVAQFHRRLDEALLARGEIDAAGIVRSLPLTTHGGLETVVLTNGSPAAANDFDGGENTWNLQYQVAGPGYFAALGIPLLEGRALETTDLADTEPVALVNRTAAELFWPEGDAIGNSIRLGGSLDSPNPPMRIVGVVGDVRQAGLSQPVLPMVFAPVSQAGANYGGLGGRGGSLVVRSNTTETLTVNAVREVFRALDPAIPLARIRSMEEVVRSSISDERFSSLLLGLFAVVALMLTAIGVYGLMAYRVARRAPEIGIRIALGATPKTVTRAIVLQSTLLGLIGVGAGIMTVWAGSSVLEAMVSVVDTRDPFILAIAPSIVLFTTALAALVPALRASRIDPLQAIRRE